MKDFAGTLGEQVDILRRTPGWDAVAEQGEDWTMVDETWANVAPVRGGDTSGFDRDVTTMRSSLADGLGGGADTAGRTIETALAKAVASGKTGFGDLKATALAALDEIAAAALKGGVSALFGGTGGGLVSAATGLLGGLFGLPGRATGGPVSPGAAYLVGERGPELFVPTASGSVAPLGQAGGGGRDVRVAISVNAGATDAPQALARSSRQVARAVARALDAPEG